MIKFIRSRIQQATDILAVILTMEMAADAVTDSYFKAHRKMGSRDRRETAEIVFGCLRRRRELEARLRMAGLWPIDAADADSPDEASPLQQEAERLVIAWLICCYPQSLDIPFEWQHLGLPLQQALNQTPNLTDLKDALNLPDWMLASLELTLTEAEIRSLALAMQEEAPVDLRVAFRMSDRLLLGAELNQAGFEVENTPFSAFGLRMLQRKPLNQSPLFRAGMFEFQDEGSQLIGWLLQPKPGERVLDYCAGAGGKTLQLADLMNDQGEIIAADIEPSRLGRLKPRLERNQITSVRLRAVTGDGVFGEWRGQCDAVLVDAPCSGSGTLRRNPALRYQVTDLAELQQWQLQILDSAAQHVRPGGRLVYSTCSLLTEENEAVIRQFLESHEDFSMAGVQLPPDDRTLAAISQRTPALEEQLQRDGCLRLWPHLHGTDGFYAQLLLRQV